MIKGSIRSNILYLLLFVWSLWISESWMSIHNSIVHECLHQSFMWCSYDFGNFFCDWILYTARIHPRAKLLIQTSILLSSQFAYCNAYPIISIIELLSYSLSSPSLLRSSISLSDTFASLYAGHPSDLDWIGSWTKLGLVSCMIVIRQGVLRMYVGLTQPQHSSISLFFYSWNPGNPISFREGRNCLFFLGTAVGVCRINAFDQQSSISLSL